MSSTMTFVVLKSWLLSEENEEVEGGCGAGARAGGVLGRNDVKVEHVSGELHNDGDDDDDKDEKSVEENIGLGGWRWCW